jgi:hypothetical protein
MLPTNIQDELSTPASLLPTTKWSPPELTLVDPGKPGWRQV